MNIGVLTQPEQIIITIHNMHFAMVRLLLAKWCPHEGIGVTHRAVSRYVSGHRISDHIFRTVADVIIELCKHLYCVIDTFHFEHWYDETNHFVISHIGKGDKDLYAGTFVQKFHNINWYQWNCSCTRSLTRISFKIIKLGITGYGTCIQTW